MRRLVWLGLVLAAALVACGGPAPATPDAPLDAAGSGSGVDPNDGARSGTRLKLTWFAFTDGTRQWNGFYDAQRKEHCSIYDDWADGHAYCVPDTTGAVVYTDAACTQKIAQVYGDPACAELQNDYVLEDVSDGCTTHPAHLYLRGARLAAPTYYERLSDGSCYGPFSDTYYAYYQLGAEVPTSQLVQLTLGAPGDTGRIGERYFESADGMRFPWVLHDSMLDADCYPSATTDGATTATCQPSASYTSYYHDATCSQPEVELRAACPAPAYLESFSNAACPADPPTFYAVGAAVAGNALYYQSGATCAMTTGPASYTYYQAGPARTLAELTRAPDAAVSRRLQLIHYTTSDGLRSRDDDLFDTQQGAECYPTLLPDGTIRCVVFGPYISTYYRDAACTAPVDLVEIYDGPAGCAAPAVPKFAQKYLTRPPGSCAYGTEVHPISTPYAGPVYADYGTCTRYTPYESTLYSVGPAVPLTDFVAAVVSVDP
jgi:hypothetical protein